MKAVDIVEFGLSQVITYGTLQTAEEAPGVWTLTAATFETLKTRGKEEVSNLVALYATHFPR
jgi:hypothetical protein